MTKEEAWNIITALDIEDMPNYNIKECDRWHKAVQVLQEYLFTVTNDVDEAAMIAFPPLHMQGTRPDGKPITEDMNSYPRLCFKTGAEWQKSNSERRCQFLNLKDIKEAWAKLKETDGELAPSVAFLRGAEWMAGQGIISK